MFPPALLIQPPAVEDVEVDGRAGARLDLAIPVLLERLSIALHRHDTTRGPLFRSLATGGSPASVRARTHALLAHAEVREALSVVLTNEGTADLAGQLHDVAVTRYGTGEE